MRLLVSVAMLTLAACATTATVPVATEAAKETPVATQQASLDAIADDYVKLALEIDTHEAGYVDAYFGPAAWRDAANAKPRDVVHLKMAAETLLGELKRVKPANAAEAQRAKVLAAGIASARFRLDLIGGARAPFVQEATQLFALTPQLKPLKDYDAVLARIDGMVPGRGALSERVDAYRGGFAIPPEKLQAVMDAAIAECRKRTRERIALPDNERFEMELVKGKSWSAYNYYKGGNQSLIQINTDLPVVISQALVLGCHEGYPGHHVQGIYNEKQYKERGWNEFSIAPLYAPSSPLNEGGADYALDLAFPEPERAKFETDVLYPLAGLDPRGAPKFADLGKALDELQGARLTIAQMYLDREIGKEEAIRLVQRYQLVSRERAQQSLSFMDEYRSYVINYASGEDLVREHVERQASDAAGRWKAYEKMLAEPTLPEDLK